MRMKIDRTIRDSQTIRDDQRIRVVAVVHAHGFRNTRRYAVGREVWATTGRNAK